jgi:DNA mismatch repair protein MutL
VGSNFTVRNIFYNIPARRKFLKSDAAEYRQVISEFTRVALTRPDRHFSFSNNGAEIFSLPPSNLRQRIQGLAGKELGRELVELSVDTTIVKIKGYIGKPEDARKTPGNQYFFVNGRFFRSPYFQKAVLKAYDNLIQEGTIPSFFIFFEVDQERIDVNIHPAKTEVKFEDDSAIFDILHSACRESLGRNSFMPSIDFDMEGAPEIPKVKSGYWAPQPKVNYDPLFNPFRSDVVDSFESRGAFSATPSQERGYARDAAHSGGNQLFKENGITQKPILQFGGRYIATTLKSGIMLIDIRRARERILYERYLNSLSVDSADIQKTLFPFELTLSESQVSVVEENASRILQLGFDIQKSEEGKYILCGIPHGFSEEMENIEKITDSLLSKLAEAGSNFGAELREQIALTLAGAGAGCKRGEMNNMEAQALVDALFACREPMISPAGRPCVNTMTIDEIEGRLAF